MLQWRLLWSGGHLAGCKYLDPKEKKHQNSQKGEIHELFVLAFSLVCREGANREKLTVKKSINNEMFFSPFMSLLNREKLCVNREKIGTTNPPFFHR